jgi:hypothetical protein
MFALKKCFPFKVFFSTLSLFTPQYDICVRQKIPSQQGNFYNFQKINQFWWKSCSSYLKIPVINIPICFLFVRGGYLVCMAGGQFVFMQRTS